MRAATSEQRRLPIPLLLILLCAGVPLLLAGLMVSQRWAPQTATNQGELLQPPIPLDSWHVQQAAQPWRPAPRWQLLLYRYHCDTACEQWLQTLNALQRLLGKDRARLHYALITDSTTRAAMQESAALARTAGSPSVPRKARANDLLLPVNAPALKPALYLADPLGNIILRYPLDVDPKAILRDLKRLFKASQIG